MDGSRVGRRRIALGAVLAATIIGGGVAQANGDNAGRLERDCFQPQAFVRQWTQRELFDPNIPVTEGVGYFGGIQVFENRSAKSGPNRVMCAGYISWSFNRGPFVHPAYDERLDGRERHTHRLADIWNGFAGNVLSFRVYAAKGCRTTASLYTALVPAGRLLVAERTVGAMNAQGGTLKGWSWPRGNPDVDVIKVKTVCPARTIRFDLPYGPYAGGVGSLAAVGGPITASGSDSPGSASSSYRGQPTTTATGADTTSQ